MKRLFLGIVLILGTSSVLLISDWGRRQPGPGRESLTKKWKVHLIELNNVLDVEESEQGILKGLEETKLVPGRDYEIKIRNAQGDMATVNALVDASLSEGADLLITLSTPTLQAAIQRAQQRIPIVFTYVASAIAAGAGRSNEDHLPNVTGVPMVAAYDEMMPLIRQSAPGVRRIGTLFVPAEVNMVFNKEELVKAARKAGLEVAAVGVNVSSDVPDSALALTAQRIDAICQIPGNLTAAAFGGIVQAAHRAKIPIFAFQQVQAREGAAVVVSRDYYDAGREAAHMAARIMRGEDQRSIPFHPFSKTKLVVNLGAARAAGLRLPRSVLSRASEIIGN